MFIYNVCVCVYIYALRVCAVHTHTHTHTQTIHTYIHTYVNRWTHQLVLEEEGFQDAHHVADVRADLREHILVRNTFFHMPA